MDDSAGSAPADATQATGDGSEQVAPTEQKATGRDLTDSERSLLRAIAKTNGHPNPDDYVAAVAGNIEGEHA